MQKESLIAKGCPSIVKWNYFCTSHDTRNRVVQTKNTTWKYFKCNCCGTIRIGEYLNVTDVYESEKVHAVYPAPKLIVRFAHKLLGHPLKRLLGTLDFSGYRILDVGCANGQKLYEFYTRKAKEVYGIELTNRKLDVAKKYMPNGHFFSGFLKDSNFPKNYFDLVIADNVMEHIEHPDIFFQELLEYINPHGKLLIFVPHGNSFSVRKLKNASISIWPPFHVNLFTKKYFMLHFPNINCQFYTKTYFFMLKKSLEKYGLPKILLNLIALVLLPFAQEELIVIGSLKVN